MRDSIKAYVVGILAALAVLSGYVIAQTGGGSPPVTTHSKKGSFTVTFGGCTTSPTGTAVYTQVWNGTGTNPPFSGWMASVQIPFISCTASGGSTQFTLSGFPSNLSTGVTVKQTLVIENAGASVVGMCQLNATVLQCSTIANATFTGTIAFGDIVTSANQTYNVSQ